MFARLCAVSAAIALAAPLSAATYTFGELYLENPDGAELGYTTMSGFVQTSVQNGGVQVDDYALHATYTLPNYDGNGSSIAVSETIEPHNSFTWYANPLRVGGAEGHYSNLNFVYELYAFLHFEEIRPNSTKLKITGASVYAPMWPDYPPFDGRILNGSEFHYLETGPGAEDQYLTLAAVPLPLSVWSGLTSILALMGFANIGTRKRRSHASTA